MRDTGTTSTTPPASLPAQERAYEDGTTPALSYPLLLLTVSLGTVLAPLNSTMLAVALPEIREDFGIGHGAVAWLVSAYLIAMAVAQPLGGRLGDQLGRARVFRLGLASFLVLAVAAAFAPTFLVLVLLRAGQALTGATAIPNGMAMLRESLPVSRLGRATGITGSVTSFSAAAGPVLGAGLLAAGSWRWLFLVNLPLVGAALICQALLRYPDRASGRRFVFDWLGAAAYGALLTCVTVLLGALRGGRSAAVLVAGTLGLVASAALFLYRQRTGPLGLVEWRLFRIRSYAAAAAYVLLSNLVMYTTLLTLPFFIREVQGKGNATTGTLLGAMSILMAVVTPFAGQLSDARGRRLPSLLGSLIMLAAVAALLAGISRDVAYAYLATCMVVLGLGVGLSTGPASVAGIETAPRSLAGAAAGANSMMRYLGSIAGTGVLGAVLSGAAAPGIGVFRLVFAVLLAVAALAAAATLFIHRFPGESPNPPPPFPAREGGVESSPAPKR